MAFQTPQTALPNASPPVSRERAPDPRIRLAQLARLHDEAQETAMLANLLGRTPQVAIALGGCALLAAALTYGAMPIAQTVIWLVLVGAGIGALWRGYAGAIAAPFERASLKNFAADLSAILFYAGFAWGAGAFLALPASWGIAAVAAFAAGPCALVAGFLQSRIPAWAFVAPVGLLTAVAVAIRPLGGGLAEAGLVLLACAAIGLLSDWMQRLSRPDPSPNLGDLALR
jgi:hypothetical protein